MAAGAPTAGRRGGRGEAGRAGKEDQARAREERRTAAPSSVPFRVLGRLTPLPLGASSQVCSAAGRPLHVALAGPVARSAARRQPRHRGCGCGGAARAGRAAGGATELRWERQGAPRATAPRPPRARKAGGYPIHAGLESRASGRSPHLPLTRPGAHGGTAFFVASAFGSRRVLLCGGAAHSWPDPLLSDDFALNLAYADGAPNGVSPPGTSGGLPATMRLTRSRPVSAQRRASGGSS